MLNLLSFDSNYTIAVFGMSYHYHSYWKGFFCLTTFKANPIAIDEEYRV